MGNLDKIKKLDCEIEAPADFTSPEVLYNELIAAIRKYHPSDDISMIEKAIGRSRMTRMGRPGA